MAPCGTSTTTVTNSASTWARWTRSVTCSPPSSGSTQPALQVTNECWIVLSCDSMYGNVHTFLMWLTCLERRRNQVTKRASLQGSLWHLAYPCRLISMLPPSLEIVESVELTPDISCIDFSYAVIATTKQNVFVYKQNCAVNGDLRNRKSGRKFANVGKQFLITLSCTDEILGLHASNDFIFVLTRSSLFVYRMKNVD